MHLLTHVWVGCLLIPTFLCSFQMVLQECQPGVSASLVQPCARVSAWPKCQPAFGDGKVRFQVPFLGRALFPQHLLGCGLDLEGVSNWACLPLLGMDAFSLFQFCGLTRRPNSLMKSCILGSSQHNRQNSTSSRAGRA